MKNLDRFGFKAISKRTGQWVYANMEETSSGCYGIRCHYNENEVYADVNADPETICQCTGLRDSDGKLIYENDYVTLGKRKGSDIIYRISNYEGFCNFEMVYEDGAAIPLATLELLLRHDKRGCIKVVGNKYDLDEHNKPKMEMEE